MASSIQLLRSTIAQERPFPGNLLEGQPAVNLNTSEPGLFFKAADGSLVKFGPAAITSDGSPPNSSPQGSSGNTVGELWLDKSVDPAVLKVYDGTAWVDAGSGGGGGGGGTASFVRWIYTAAGGETSLSGSSNGVLLEYTPGLEEVFVNGVLITRGTDYSATNGTSITNLAALTAGDVITVTSMNPLETVQLPGQVTLARWTIDASSGQSVLVGPDSSGLVLNYTPGFEEVFVNGAFLRRGLDYIATNESSITLSQPLTVDDEVTVMIWSAFEVSNVADGSITESKLATGAVTSSKILNGAIVDANVNPNAGIEASKLSFQQNGIGAQLQTVDSKLKNFVNVNDFIPPGTDTLTTNCQPYIQAAVNYAESLVYLPLGWIGDPIGGVTVYFNGNYRVHDPIRVGRGNIKLLGEAGTSILPYYTSNIDTQTGQVYNGAKPVFIVGNAEDWQTSGSITGAIKYNCIEGFIIKRNVSPASYIGILVSGTRNCTVRRCLVEISTVGVYLENTSEALVEQVSVIGTGWCYVLDSRKNRPAEHSVLNVANVDNDVSSNRFDMLTAYYPQHTGLLAFDTGTCQITGMTIGEFSDLPSVSPPLGFPIENVGFHVTGGTTGPGTTRGMLAQDIVFEAGNTEAKDCIRVDAANNHPVFGVTFDNCTVQTYKRYSLSDLAQNSVCTLLRVGQGGNDIVGLTLRKSGYIATTLGYFYGDLVASETSADLLVQDCFPSIALASSNLGVGGRVNPSEYFYRLDPSSGFVSPGWTGVNTGSSILVQDTGQPSAWVFTGVTDDCYIHRTFSFKEYKPSITGPIITFLYRGTGELYFKVVVNNDGTTDSSLKNGVNAGRYSNALVDPIADTDYKRATITFNTFSANYPFDLVDIFIGRKASANPADTAEIVDFRVGYFEGNSYSYNPF